MTENLEYQKALWDLAQVIQGVPLFSVDEAAIAAAFPGLSLAGDESQAVKAALDYVAKHDLAEAVLTAKSSEDDPLEGIEPFKAKTLPELLDGPTEIDWQVDRIAPVGTSGCIVGEGGIGKSLLLLQLILAVASGRPWLGKFETRRGPVLMVDEENAELLLRVRLMMLMAGQGLTVADLAQIHFLVGRAVDLTPEKTSSGKLIGSESYWRLYKTIAEIKPALVTFDSLTRVHHSNENYAHEMAPVFNYAKRFINDLGCNLVFAHHTNKAGTYRGSTDIYNNLDWALQLEKDADGLAVEHIKPRWDEQVDRFKVDWRIDKAKGELALVYAGDAPKSKKGKDDIKDTWEFIKDLLGKNGKMSRPAILAEIEGAGVCKVRTMDNVLKWRHEHEFLGKSEGTRPVYYWLLERPESVTELATRIDASEPVDVMAMAGLGDNQAELATQEIGDLMGLD